MESAGKFFRGNDGGDFMAVPPQAPASNMGASEEEIKALQEQRLGREGIEARVAELEAETGANPEHPKYQELVGLREELAKMDGNQ